MRRLMRVGGSVGVKDQLEDAAAVAEVDEDQPAVIAAAVDPAATSTRRPWSAIRRSPAQLSR